MEQYANQWSKINYFPFYIVLSTSRVSYSFHTWDISTIETFFTSRASIPDAGTQKSIV